MKENKEDYYKLKDKHEKLVKEINLLIADAKDNSSYIYKQSGKHSDAKVRVEYLIAALEDL